MSYPAMIEKAWIQAQSKIGARKKSPTTKKLVLMYLLKSIEIWNWSWEFQGKKVGKFTLSYRACARASDLAIHHPELVECRKHRGFAAYRVRTENLDKVKKFLES